MSTTYLSLALLMGLATYPWRAVPLLAPGMHRLPSAVQEYLRLVGPAVLAALAAVNTFIAIDAERHASPHVGIEWLAVGICITLIALRRSLLVGLVVAAGMAAAARAAGLA